MYYGFAFGINKLFYPKNEWRIYAKVLGYNVMVGNSLLGLSWNYNSHKHSTGIYKLCKVGLRTIVLFYKSAPK